MNKRVIGWILQDVRTLEYVAIDATGLPVMTHDITAAHIYPDADAAHNARRHYQQVRELLRTDPPHRVYTIGDVLARAGLGLSVLLILYGVWGLL